MARSKVKLKVFISHTHEEMQLAGAWKTLIEAISAQTITAWYSSDPHPNGGVTPGEPWRKDLEQRLREYDFVLAIQTPLSTTRSWIMWECGIANGIYSERQRNLAANAAENTSQTSQTPREHGIIPIVYSIKRGELVNPLSVYQVYEGESIEQIRQVCEFLTREAKIHLKDEIFTKALQGYFAEINAFGPPRVVTRDEMDIWRQRFQQLRAENRTAEVPAMRLRMYNSLVTPFVPIEASIHDMLSSLLLQEKKYQEVLQEVDYALQLLKNDIDLLHRKLLALVELQNLQQAEEIVNRIFTLKPGLRQDPEYASLAGRIQRERWMLTLDPTQLDAAIEAYQRAYQADKQQYYPGINVAELLLRRGDIEQATQVFQELLITCRQLQTKPDASYWVDFTLGAVYLGLAQVDEASAEYKKGLKRTPTPLTRDRESAAKGATRMVIASRLPEALGKDIRNWLL